jgi:hypothetical protein
VNEQSLRESNAILAAAAERTEVGGIIPVPPAELARESGVESRLSVARAIRALLARGRLAQEGDRYRLVDARAVEAGEPATVHRPIRRRRREAAVEGDGRPTYEQMGRLVIDRLVELSAENAELRTALERLRQEAEAARREAMEVRRQGGEDRRRADGMEDEVTTLRRRLEMTESNLRSLVDAAKNRPASPLEDTDAQAILEILGRTQE